MRRKLRSGARTTLKDIAAVCEVSHAAVSAALSGSKGNVCVSQATKERIQKVAKEMGYHPHHGARSLRRNRFDALGFFHDHIFPDSSIHNTLESAVSNAVIAAGCQMILTRPRHELSEDRLYIEDLIRAQCVDTFVAMSVATHSLDMPGIFNELGIPCVHLNRKCEKNSVFVDDIQGGKLITQHLLEQGYRKILYLQTSTLDGRHYSIADRHAGHISVMRDWKIDPVVIDFPHTERERGERGALFNSLFEKHKPDAVITNNDALAVRVQRYILAAGMMPGRDVAVTGFNDGSVATYSPVPLTTIRIPWKEMARTAAEMALSLVGDKKAEQNLGARCFLPSLVIRDSAPRKA